jgi:hypothetical protein
MAMAMVKAKNTRFAGACEVLCRALIPLVSKTVLTVKNDSATIQEAVMGSPLRSDALIRLK